MCVLILGDLQSQRFWTPLDGLVWVMLSIMRAGKSDYIWDRCVLLMQMHHMCICHRLCVHM